MRKLLRDRHAPGNPRDFGNRTGNIFRRHYSLHPRPNSGVVPKRPKGMVCKTIMSSVQIRPTPPIFLFDRLIFPDCSFEFWLKTPMFRMLKI